MFEHLALPLLRLFRGDVIIEEVDWLCIINQLPSTRAGMMKGRVEIDEVIQRSLGRRRKGAKLDDSHNFPGAGTQLGGVLLGESFHGAAAHAASERVIDKNNVVPLRSLRCNEVLDLANAASQRFHRLFRATELKLRGEASIPLLLQLRGHIAPIGRAVPGPMDEYEYWCRGHDEWLTIRKENLISNDN